MINIHTEIGKIYYIEKFPELGDFDPMIARVVDVIEEDDGSHLYTLQGLEDDFKTFTDRYINTYDEGYKFIREHNSLLKSAGILSITNVVSTTYSQGREIKDVLVIFFPNNRITRVPEINQPYIVARQGINNLYADMAGSDEVGMSVSLDTLPSGYALSDFMVNDSVMCSRLVHCYLIDDENTLSRLLDNEDSNKILQDLFDHEIMYKANTDVNFKYEDKKDDCVGGYCNSIKSFLVHTDFMSDLYNCLGIVKVDFKLNQGEPLSIDDILFLVAVCGGGLRINKAVPLKFDYFIDMEPIKMKYFLVSDVNNDLYIVPYTETSDEIPISELYNLTEERTNKLQERLSKCVKTYLESTSSNFTPEEQKTYRDAIKAKSIDMGININDLI